MEWRWPKSDAVEMPSPPVSGCFLAAFPPSRHSPPPHPSGPAPDSEEAKYLEDMLAAETKWRAGQNARLGDGPKSYALDDLV